MIRYYVRAVGRAPHNSPAGKDFGGGQKSKIQKDADSYSADRRLHTNSQTKSLRTNQISFSFDSDRELLGWEDGPAYPGSNKQLSRFLNVSTYAAGNVVQSIAF